MFIVRTSLRPSVIQGLGCFAEEPLKKGQVVWQYDPRIDIRIPMSELPSFPPVVQEHLLTYTYVELVDGQEVMVYCADLPSRLHQWLRHRRRHRRAAVVRGTNGVEAHEPFRGSQPGGHS